jgi:hypothetical protein
MGENEEIEHIFRCCVGVDAIIKVLVDGYMVWVIWASFYWIPSDIYSILSDGLFYYHNRSNGSSMWWTLEG